MEQALTDVLLTMSGFNYDMEEELNARIGAQHVRGNNYFDDEYRLAAPPSLIISRPRGQENTEPPQPTVFTGLAREPLTRADLERHVSEQVLRDGNWGELAETRIQVVKPTEQEAYLWTRTLPSATHVERNKEFELVRAHNPDAYPRRPGEVWDEPERAGEHSRRPERADLVEKGRAPNPSWQIGTGRLSRPEEINDRAPTKRPDLSVQPRADASLPLAGYTPSLDQMRMRNDEHVEWLRVPAGADTDFSEPMLPEMVDKGGRRMGALEIRTQGPERVGGDTGGSHRELNQERVWTRALKPLPIILERELPLLQPPSENPSGYLPPSGQIYDRVATRTQPLIEQDDHLDMAFHIQTLLDNPYAIV